MPKANFQLIPESRSPEIATLEDQIDTLYAERIGERVISKTTMMTFEIARQIEKEADAIKAEFAAQKPFAARWTPRGTGFAIVVVTEDTPFSFYARIISTDENFSGRSWGVTHRQGKITQAMRDEVIEKLEKIAKRAVYV